LAGTESKRQPDESLPVRGGFAALEIYANGGNFYSGSTYKHPRNALASGDGGEFDSVFDKADRVSGVSRRRA
jgi:hypothetical protein